MGLSTFYKTDGVDDVMAVIVNQLIAGNLRGELANPETLAATKVMTDDDLPIQWLDCDGAAREVDLPAEGINNHIIVIYNSSAGAYAITVKDDSATTTIATVSQGEMKIFLSNGAAWKAVMWIPASDGWIPAVGTWSYASASTITIPSDGTTVYDKGMRIRFKQGGGYKYGVVYSVTATLITLIVNTDYTVANAVITDVYYSFIENPLGWPDWFNYAPTYSASGSMTFTGVTGAAKWRAVGKKVEHLIYATGTVGGTASNQLRATVACTLIGDWPAVANYYDGSITYTARGKFDAGLIYMLKSDSSNLALGAGQIMVVQGSAQF